MNQLTLRLTGVNWKLVLAVVSILSFALAGSADDSNPY